jgi:hypothetical protein
MLSESQQDAVQDALKVAIMGRVPMYRSGSSGWEAAVGSQVWKRRRRGNSTTDTDLAIAARLRANVVASYRRCRG